MNPKYFAVFFLIASTATGELIDPLGPAREECRIKSRLTRKQLADSKHHLEKVPNYIVCLIQTLGIPTNERGELDVGVTAAVVEPVTPRSLSIPITGCCNAQVVASRARTPGEQAVVFAKCLVATLVAPLFDAAGYLKEPVYPPLDKCYRSIKKHNNF